MVLFGHKARGGKTIFSMEKQKGFYWGGASLKYLKKLIFALLLLTLLGGCESGKGELTGSKLSPESPVMLSVWVYYNGAQLEAMNSLVKQFNETKGKEKGIYVDVFSHGTVGELRENVLSAYEKANGGDIPNIFSAYPDTAYEFDNMGRLVDLSQYLTQEEQEQFIPSYIEEGRITNGGSFKIFPVAKSVEVFMLNKTDWDTFAAETGATYEDFSTMEGLVDVAELYYEWTDGLTPKRNDGKAFFGRDAMANYFFLGAKELGHELITKKDNEVVIDFDKEVVKKLWDHYYIPYVKGYFSSAGRFRSDDVKMGSIISFVGSSAGATFFPQQVILSDTESYPIEMEVFRAPKFSEGDDYAVQQGAGMVVTKGTEQEIQASVEFLKWFTHPDRNIAFSIDSGYLPVTKEANQIDTILKGTPEISEPMKHILTVGVETVHENTLFTPVAFEKGSEVRDILTHSLEDLAKEDRKTVEVRLKRGMSQKRAVAEFTSEAYFNKWYQQVLQELENITA